MSQTHGLSERPEDLSIRRAQGRSEHPSTLEEQLDVGLEDTFPASDPVSVISTTIAGQSKKLVGTDEALAQKRRARAELTERHDAERRKAERQSDYGGVIAIGALIAGMALTLGSLVWIASRDRR